MDIDVNVAMLEGHGDETFFFDSGNVSGGQGLVGQQVVQDVIGEHVGDDAVSIGVQQ